jgi:hypothetical protein
MKKTKQKLPLTSAILADRFERRTFVLGMGQATVGVLLASRLAYLSIFENAKYKAASESNRVNLSLIPRAGAGCSTAMARRSPPTVPISVST